MDQLWPDPRWNNCLKFQYKENMRSPDKTLIAYEQKFLNKRSCQETAYHNPNKYFAWNWEEMVCQNDTRSRLRTKVCDYDFKVTSLVGGGVGGGGVKGKWGDGG